MDDISKANVFAVNYLLNSTLNPLKDPYFKLNEGHQKLLWRAIIALSTRYGNCQARAALVSKYLLERSEGVHRIEGITLDTFDHVIVVVNRSGDLKKPSTWGDAWIIDAWYKNGVVFHAKEFEEKIKQIKEYAEEQAKKCRELEIFV